MNRLVVSIPAALLLVACQGNVSKDPPVHLQRNMLHQDKYKPEQESPFFADGRTMRPVVEGTVAQGQLNEDDAYYRGESFGKPIAKIPVNVDEKLLARGEERFGIYCSPCHDKTGSGGGMVVKRGYPTPINLTTDYVGTQPDGQIFQTITNGIRNMPPYRFQVPVEDRWAIVAWVRVLGKSQNAKMADVPADMASKIEPEGATP